MAKASTYNGVDANILESLRELDDGKDHFLGEVIQLFFETVPPVISALRTAIEEENSQAVGHLAHRLKGLCANLGATEMVSLCANLEHGERSSQLPEAEKLFKDLISEFERVKSTLALVMSEKNDNKEKTASIETTIRYLGDDRMLELMTEVGTRKSLPEIKAYLMRVIWGKHSCLPSDVLIGMFGDEAIEISEPFREQILALWNELCSHRNPDHPFCFQRFEPASCAEDFVARVHWRVKEVQMLMPLFSDVVGTEATSLKQEIIASLEELAIMLDHLSTDLPATESKLLKIDAELESGFNRLGQLCRLRGEANG